MPVVQSPVVPSSAVPSRVVLSRAVPRSVVLSRVVPVAADQELPELDPIQAAVAAHRGGRAVLLGAPGTGKTTAALAAVLARIRTGTPAAACLLISGSRVSAARQRDRLAVLAGATASAPLARTASSVAFGLLRRQAVLDGLPAPNLLSGPEQDAVLRELLAGHAAGAGPAPGWPTHLAEALSTRGFRAELRNLLMRAAERGLTSLDLEDLGRAHGRPEWVAAARVAAEYEAVTALSQPGGFDPAALLATAAELLEDDPCLLAAALPGLALVVVDDAQDLTPPGARLVAALTSAGAELLLVGDPDAGTQAFRGGDPRSFLELGREAPTHVLGTRWRQAAAPAAVTARVAGRVGSVGTVAARRAQLRPGAPDGAARVVLARSPAQEARHVAEHLRRAHLLDGVPWSQMAVIVRGAGRTATLRRVLAASRVPVVVPGAHVPLRDEPVVAALLTLLEMVLAAARGDADPVPAPAVAALLSSPLGGMDAVALRRLRRALRAQELATDTGRRVDEALAAGMLGDGSLTGLGSAASGAWRLARAVAAGRAAATRDGDRWAVDVTAEGVLWAIWSGLGLADTWRRTAIDGGAGADRADRDLDAVVALFDSAAVYVDRLPGRGPDGFLDHLRGQDVAGDMLADRAPVAEAVTLTTPAGAAGLEWDVVAVCGVQEGVWPDLRLRGSVLGSQVLVDLAAGRPSGPREARAAVRHDETRLFHVAVGCARRDLLVTAVANEDEQPSPYVDLVDPDAPGGPEGRVVAPVLESMSPSGVVARLRRELAFTRHEDGAGAVARRLALLAAEGVPGADPAQWWALVDPTDARPRRDDDAPVRVSPSRVESFEQCELRWLLTSSGGERPRSGGADVVGSLVHAIAAEVDNADLAVMQTELDRRWPDLGLPSGWLSERRRGQAHDMLARLATYHRQTLAAGIEVVGRELAGSAVVGRADIRGRVDRLERDPHGRLRVVDLKTGSTKRRRDDLPRMPQLGVYQVLVESGAFDATRVEERDAQACVGLSAGAALLQVGGKGSSGPDLQVQGPLATDEDPAWAERLIRDSAERMAGAYYTARVGDWCRMCSGRSCCPISGDGKAI